MRCMFRKIRTCGDGSNKTIPTENGGSGGNEKRPHDFHTKFNNSSSNYYHSPSVPISICVMILICYVTLGAVLFHKIQHWGVLESLYFCFTSLGTIGMYTRMICELELNILDSIVECHNFAYDTFHCCLHYIFEAPQSFPASSCNLAIFS